MSCFDGSDLITGLTDAIASFNDNCEDGQDVTDQILDAASSLNLSIDTQDALQAAIALDQTFWDSFLAADPVTFAENAWLNFSLSGALKGLTSVRDASTELTTSVSEDIFGANAIEDALRAELDGRPIPQITTTSSGLVYSSLTTTTSTTIPFGEFFYGMAKSIQVMIIYNSMNEPIQQALNAISGQETDAVAPFISYLTVSTGAIAATAVGAKCTELKVPPVATAVLSSFVGGFTSYETKQALEDLGQWVHDAKEANPSITLEQLQQIVHDHIVDQVNDDWDETSTTATDTLSAIQDTLDCLTDAIQDAAQGNGCEDPGSWLDAVIPHWGNTHVENSPLVLDLSSGGTGLSLTALNSSGAVYWDIANEGFGHASGWTTGNTGLLAIDLNLDGVINNNSELFGNEPATGIANGFQALAAYDSNGDGVIDANDARFNDLLIWQDTNHDGVSQPSELHTLASLNITSINLNYTDVNYAINGNTIKQESTFVIDGHSRTIADAWLAYDKVNTVYNGDFTLNEATYFLPTARGYGLLPDLCIAMSLDDNTSDPNSLLSRVESFANGSFDDLFVADGSILAEVQQIMYRWAGVDTVSPSSRGPFFDGQELGFLEKLMGEGYNQQGWSTDPAGILSANDLTQAWELALNHTYATLLAQTTAGDLFTGNVSYDPRTDAVQNIAGLNLDRLSDLETEATGLSTTAAKDSFWRDVVRMVEYTVGTSNLSSSDQTSLDSAIHTSDSSLSLSGILGEMVLIPNQGSTITGTSANETLTGGNNNDTIVGGGGNDTLIGGQGHDQLTTGSGNDVLNGGTGGDYLQGGDGDDTYVYNIGDGYDTILDTSGNDKILLGSGFVGADFSFSRGGNNDLVISFLMASPATRSSSRASLLATSSKTLYSPTIPLSA